MVNFRVGQKVVCVDDSPSWDTRLKVLELKKVYTILQVVPIDPSWRVNNDRPGLHFLEIDSDRASGFAGRRFRPLVSLGDDVEMFRRISEDSLGRSEAYEEMLNEQFSCDETHQ